MKSLLIGKRGDEGEDGVEVGGHKDFRGWEKSKKNGKSRVLCVFFWGL